MGNVGSRWPAVLHRGVQAATGPAPTFVIPDMVWGMLAPDGGGGGFRVDADVLFTAAVQMVATKDYVYGIEAGLAGDLHVSAGMAGDDRTGHAFAAKYEPAARIVVAGVGSAGQAIAVTASKLLATATDFLAADNRAAGRLAPHVATESFAAPPQPDCEPQNAAAQLPMVTGSARVHEIPVIGQFWPQGDPDKLRDTALVWQAAANLMTRNAMLNSTRPRYRCCVPVTPLRRSRHTCGVFMRLTRRVTLCWPRVNR